MLLAPSYTDSERFLCCYDEYHLELIEAARNGCERAINRTDDDEKDPVDNYGGDPRRMWVVHKPQHKQGYSAKEDTPLCGIVGKCLPLRPCILPHTAITTTNKLL